MKKILILFPYQWGYNTDYLFYSKLLQEKYQVTYIGYDLNLPAIPSDGVKLIQIKHTGKLSIIDLYRTVIQEVKSDTYSHLLINYFITSSILLLLLPARIRKIVDIRTSFIYPGKLKSMFFNGMMKMETAMFKNITVVSQGVKDFLKLPQRTHVLPLGGPGFPLYDKDFNSLRFLYVGTFYDRNIVNTVHAFSKLVNDKSKQIDMYYTIIGYGSVSEVAAVKEAIVSLGMEHFISYKGTVRYPELNAYFETHNIGVSYIPMTDYYDCQPPTKTFEYLLSGNVVLGTNTTENARIITPDNGVLVGDSVEAFYEGMLRIFDERSRFNSGAIQLEAKDHTWQAIVNDNLIPYLSSCRT